MVYYYLQWKCEFYIPVRLDDYVVSRQEGEYAWWNNMDRIPCVRRMILCSFEAKISWIFCSLNWKSRTCECSGAVYMVWLFVFSVSGLILAMIFSSSRSSEFKLEFIVDSDWSESFGSSSDDCSSTTGSTIGCGVGVFLLFAGCGFADCNFFGDGLGETNFRDLARGFRPLLDGSFLVILRVLVRLAIGDCSVDLPCDSAVTTCDFNIKNDILE